MNRRRRWPSLRSISLDAAALVGNPSSSIDRMKVERQEENGQEQ